VKEIDDTPLPESESEVMVEVDFADLLHQVTGLLFEIEQLRLSSHSLGMQINELELRIANLETQRTPQDENDDPEWFS